LRRECDRRGEADGGGNPAGHEANRRMINRGKKMIFATGARKRGAQFTIAKRATERDDSADDPQEKKRETGMNILQLKSQARKNAGANDVGDNDRAGSEEADRSPGIRRFHRRDKAKTIGGNDFFEIRSPAR
jgi:hypothetical protein